jgi:hypothetical protein
MIILQGSKATAITPGEITTAAQVRLRESGFEDLSALICEEYDGVLRLRGTLPSAQRLQQVMAMLAAIPGVRGIDNRVALAGRAARRAASTVGTH